MAKYLLVYHGGREPRPEERKQVMDDWGAWMGKLGAAVADGGNPIGHAKTIASSGSVSDGGGANAATGYSVLKADNLDAAVNLAKGCPHLKFGGSIEVAEIIEVM